MAAAWNRAARALLLGAVFAAALAAGASAASAASVSALAPSAADADVETCVTHAAWARQRAHALAHLAHRALPPSVQRCARARAAAFRPTRRRASARNRLCFARAAWGAHLARALVTCVRERGDALVARSMRVAAWGGSGGGHGGIAKKHDPKWVSYGWQHSHEAGGGTAKEHKSKWVSNAWQHAHEAGGSDGGGGATEQYPQSTSPPRQCTCRSGCHFCCVLVGIGGDGVCFKRACRRGTRYCA